MSGTTSRPAYLPERFTLEPQVPLAGDVDVEAVVAWVRADQRTKGMLYGDAVTVLQPRWKELQATLEDPPRLGRYLPFVEYASRDYMRLMCAAAATKFPRLPSREANRLFGRGAIELFKSSQLGRVVMSMLDGPVALLTKYPSVYVTLVKGTPVSASQTGPRSFAFVFPDFAGLAEYLLGSLEASVMTYDFSPTLAAEFKRDDLHVDIRW